MEPSAGLFRLALSANPRRVELREAVNNKSFVILMYAVQDMKMPWNSQGHDLQTYVPPTKKLNVRSDRSHMNDCDAYGLQPLCHPFKLLSAYEFLRHWQTIPLLVPTYYTNRNSKPHTQ